MFSRCTAASNTVPAVRISPKVLLSMLLLVSVVPLFFAPNVNSQQFTTVTSFQTSTTTSTETRSSTIPNFMYLPVPMPVPSKGYTCQFSALEIVNIRTGFTLSTFVILSPWLLPTSLYAPRLTFDLYLLDPQAFNEYRQRSQQNHQIVCDPLSIPSIHPFFQGKDHFVYSFNFTSPMDTNYWLLIVNRNTYTSIEVGIDVDVIEPYSVTGTQTLTFTKLETSEIPFLQANASWLLPVALFAVVVVLFLALRMRTEKRRKRR